MISSWQSFWFTGKYDGADWPLDNASRPFSNILCQLKSTKLLNHEKQHFLNGFKLIALAYHTTDDTLEQGMSPTQMS